MNKKFFTIALLCGLCSMAAFAQYKPTEKDLGKDCATENGKLGTWKQVNVTERSENSNSRGNSNSTSNTGSVGVSAKAKVGIGEVGASASYQNTNTNSQSNTKSTSTSTTRSYQDIQCVEDKNANLPQMTPIRW